MKKRALIPIGFLLALVILFGGLLYAGSKQNIDTVPEDEIEPGLEIGKSESFGTDDISPVAPTATPTVLLSIKSGSRFRVLEVQKNGYTLNGYTYDLGTFVAEDKITIIKGICVDPGWKIPEAERVYVFSGGLLVPKKDRVDAPLQRFQVIR